MEIIDTIFTDGVAEKGRIYLTATHVSHSGKRLGYEWYVSIPLHLLSSISFTYVAPVGWLVFGIVAVLIAVGLGVVAAMALNGIAQDAVIIAEAIAGLVFPASLVSFFYGRKQLLVFASSSEKITFVVGGTDKKLLRNFALMVEEQQVKLVQGFAGLREEQ
jgi:hypothetical protein